MKFSRRAILRGIGAAAALPMLDAMPTMASTEARKSPTSPGATSGSRSAAMRP